MRLRVAAFVIAVAALSGGMTAYAPDGSVAAPSAAAIGTSSVAANQAAAAYFEITELQPPP